MVIRKVSKWGSYEVRRYADDVAGLSFSVAPERGACLTDLVIGGVSLLDGYIDASELGALDWGKSAILAPFPNRLKDGKYTFLGADYQFPINEPARNNALHGFVMDKPFEVVEEKWDSEGFSMALAYRYDGGFTFYPFPFSLRVRYSLSAARGFDVFFEMENTGSGPMPAGLGWHPYFRLGDSVDSVSLQFPGGEKIRVDERMIPTGEKAFFGDFREMRRLGETAFDTGFRLPGPLSGPFQVRLKKGSQELVYWQDEAFPFLQLFIPPARRSIALEPMTCNIDAFHNGEGLRILSPGEAIKGRAGLIFHSTSESQGQGIN